MKFLFAPDSFKGSLTALEIAKMLDECAHARFPNVETLLVPMADGGEGTVEALTLATGGSTRRATVTDPMGRPIEATYGVLGDGKTAVIEMAQASGLPLVASGERDPLSASSVGTGELIRLALDAGYRNLLVGLGGSATNDGGMGMLWALGARFYDENAMAVEPNGAGLERVRAVSLDGLDGRLKDATITAICDVTNPLLGESGATYVYGPQKGAGPTQLRRLEAGMASYAKVMSAAVGRDIASFAGAGAAGGMGAALGGVLGARLRGGAGAVLDATRFNELLQGVSLVVTGEGRIDGQSVRYGKAVAGVAKCCAEHGVPVVAIVGGMAKGAEALYDVAQSSILTTVNAIMGEEAAMADARELFLSAADRMFRMLEIGMGIR